MADYREKIKKLLKLAESPNEHEAKDALLKARELMAEHNLEMADLQDAENRKLRKGIVDGISFSKMTDPWTAPLSAAIGTAFCCQSYRTHRPGGRTNQIGFIGLDGDIDACVAAFQYAYGFCKNETQDLRKKNRWYTAKYRRQVADSFGYGFTVGLQEQFEKQAEEHQEWGLVVVMPKEVREEAEKTLGKADWQEPELEDIKASAYCKGRRAGQNLNMNAIERGGKAHGSIAMD